MFPCPECKTLLSLNERNQDGFNICPNCGEKLIFKLFSALTASQETSVAQSVSADDESSCFYHTDKIAVQNCDYCGRFLCALCMIPVETYHLCPTCMAKGKDPTFTYTVLKRHALHDSILLLVACVSIMFGPLTLVTSPVIFFYFFKYYRKDLGLVPRMKWRYWLAGIVAAIPFFAWASMLILKA